MRLLLLLFALVGFYGCGKCKAASDCSMGEHCQITTGECLPGCRSASDCAPTARCDTATGNCRPTVQFPRDDSGTSTTSTITDAG